MKIKKDKVIMDSSEYINLIDKIKNLNKKLRDEKRKFYRNRKLFEEFIDVVLTSIDESILKETTNLTYKNVKEEIMKKYDEDIKYN